MRFFQEFTDEAFSSPYRKGLACGACAGLMFDAGGGEVVTEGASMQSFGDQPFRAEDRILRVGRLASLLPSGRVPRYLLGSAISLGNPFVAVARELAEADGGLGNIDALNAALGDMEFLRGFAKALADFNCVPTVEEQRLSDGTDTTVAVLLCAVRKCGGA